VEVNEEYRLEAFREPLTMNYMTPLDVEQIEPGLLKLGGNASAAGDPAADVFMRFDDALFDVRLDDLPLADERLKAGWGPALTRIVLVSKSTDLEGEFTVTFSD
jgi:hypothetical protein